MTTTRFILDILIVLFTCFGLPIIVGVFCTRQINSRIRKEREIHMRGELSVQRVLYIGQLRAALRTCNDFIDASRSLTARQLKDRINKLLTAVDTNGKPLEKTHASETHQHQH